MTEMTNQDDTILWQRNDSGVPEPALLIQAVRGCIQIIQEDRFITLSYESVSEFCKLLKVQKEP